MPEINVPLDFLLDSPAPWVRWQTRVTLYGFGMGGEFAKLRYPFVWFDILHVLEAVSSFSWAWRDARFRSLLDLVLTRADAEGRFTAESVGLEWRDLCFGQKRQPSAWLTLVVHRILRRAPRESRSARSVASKKGKGIS
jgi:hypothetical protein